MSKKQAAIPALKVTLHIDNIYKNINIQNYSQTLANDAKKAIESANKAIVCRQEELIKKQHDLLQSLNYQSPLQQLGNTLKSLQNSPLKDIWKTQEYFKSILAPYQDLITPIKIPTIGLKEQLETTMTNLAQFDALSLNKQALHDYKNLFSELHSFDILKKIDTLSYMQETILNVKSAISSIQKLAEQIYITDEKLTLKEKIAAILLTADMLTEYIDNNPHLSQAAIKEAENIIGNMKLIEYYSQKIYTRDRSIRRVKTFFQYLEKSLANTIYESDRGIYYDTLFDTIVRFIKAIDAFMHGYERYKKAQSSSFVSIVLDKNHDYKDFGYFIQVFSQLLSKKTKYNNNFIYSVIALIADELYCDEENLACCFYYLRHNERPNQAIISPKLENPIHEIKTILIF